MTEPEARVQERSMRRRSRTHVVVIVVSGIGAVMALLSIGIAIAFGTPFRLFVDSYTLTNLVIGASLLSSGSVLAWFRSSNAVGWLLLVCGTGHLAAAAAATLIMWGLSDGWPAGVTRSLTTAFHPGWLIGLPGLFLLALLLFPTGHLPSRRWLPLAIAITVSTAYNVVAAVLSDVSLLGDERTVSILSVGYQPPTALAEASTVLTGAFYVLVGLSLLERYVTGNERQKRQLLWLILAFFGAGLLNSQRWITGDGPILALLGVALFPVAIAIAILRYQLLDIRIILSRTLIYTLAIGAIIAGYVALVAGLNLVVPASADQSVPIAAAIVVALAFNPLRITLQRLITRAFYGNREDQLATALVLSQQLQRSDGDLSMLLERARQDLRLPYLALRKQPDGTTIASAGDLAGATAIATVDLAYRGHHESTLVIALRRGERTLHEADRRALSLIGVPLSVAQHAIELAEQLKSARSATAQARERERKRLHRELHDGLGPALTGAAFHADAAFNLVHTDPDGAAELLTQLRQEVRSSVSDVRRVVYGLRPVELDKYGFDGALRRRISSLNDDPRQTVTIRATVAPAFPELSPATELAAYRIVAEALENVLKHSAGSLCTVEVSVGAEIRILVDDDGEPVTEWKPGVGVESMVDRAEELGGSAVVGPSVSGWHVDVRLPLDA